MLEKSQESAAETVSGQDQAPAHARPPKTTGEKYYDWVQFLTGKAFIVAITAVLAYVAHPQYGADKYFGVPNYLKQFQGGVQNFFMHTLKLGEQEGKYAERIARIGGAATGTTLTMWGGNLFAPFLKALENRKEDISTYFNKKFGTPQQVEDGHARLHDLPKQRWSDIIKGRAVGWVIVCGSFIGLDWVLGRSKSGFTDANGKHLFHFDKYEEWFGRKVAGLQAAGKEIASTPMTTALTDLQKENKLYRFGKIVALDFYATTAAILIWNAISRGSAKKRAAQGEEQKKPGVIQPPMAAPTVLKYNRLGNKQVESAGDAVVGLGSIGKMFTAATIMQLAQDGKFSLDDKAITHFQGPSAEHQAIRKLLAGEAKDATIADLLSHRAGVANISPEYVKKTEAHITEAATIVDAANTAGPQPKYGQPSYSNLGYMILGKLIEAATGKQYQQVVKEKVIDPLGLKNTGYIAQVEGNPHLVKPTFHGQDADHYMGAGAAGSIFSNAVDLDRFVTAFATGLGNPKEEAHNPLFTAATIKRMRDSIPDNPEGGHALGFGGRKKDGVVVEVGHGGETTDFGANVRHNPSTNATDIVFVVANDVSAAAIGKTLKPTVDAYHRQLDKPKTVIQSPTAHREAHMAEGYATIAHEPETALAGRT